jgi:hypothetical protein
MCPIGLGCVLIVVVVGVLAGMGGAKIVAKQSQKKNNPTDKD